MKPDDSYKPNQNIYDEDSPAYPTLSDYIEYTTYQVLGCLPINMDDLESIWHQFSQ